MILFIEQHTWQITMAQLPHCFLILRRKRKSDLIVKFEQNIFILDDE